MYLVAPHGQKRKWDIRLRNHDCRIVKISGDRDRVVARRIGERVEMLVRAKLNGDPPPVELAAWIANMPAKLAERLLLLGLLDRKRVEHTKPIDEHVNDYEAAVAARKSNSRGHARQQATRVRRIVASQKITTIAELTEEGLSRLLAEWEISVATRRHYIVALKDFTAWMKRTKRTNENPLENMVPPGQYEHPEVERQPLTVSQFQKLTKHLDKLARYPKQKARWTGRDRKLVYWTAVRTGFRKSELKCLRRGHLLLDQKPALIVIKAGDTKNKTRGAVPIPNDLAAALKKYVAGLSPGDRVFPFPCSSGGVVDMLRRDLDGAGIPWKLETGEIVDFHTLRSTAITWWLDVDGLSPKRVQILARLKTLALVANYSRNLRLEDFGWLNRGPKLATTSRSRKSA